MLDGILGRGFASKCKSLIKVIKSRIDVIRRKKSATLKFLKKDIADLLSNGLDINAYGRVEGYIVELMLSSCYDFVEKCCDFVSKHVSVMQKLSDCPEDCREAVSSLMFAAARFSDLPELRDLRQIFHERYGNSLELFVHKQLVENSASNPSTMEKKLKVMRDIASEFSINWDSVAFEQKMSKPTVIQKDQPKKYGSFHVNGDNHKSYDAKNAGTQADKQKVLSREKLEVGGNGHRLDNCKEDNVSKRDEYIFPPKEEVSVDGYKHRHVREEAFSSKENFGIPFWQKQDVSAGKPEFWNGKHDVASKNASLSSSHGRRMEKVDDAAKLQIHRENKVSRTYNQDYLPERKPDLKPDYYAAPSKKSRDKDLPAVDSHAGEYSVQNSTRKTHDQDELKWKPHSNVGLPPPYVKPPSIKQKDCKNGANVGSSLTGFYSNGISGDPSMSDRSYPVYRTDKHREGLYHPDKEGQVIPPKRVNSHDCGNDYYYGGSDAPVPRRRSSRRRHLKSASGHIEFNEVEDTEIPRRKPRSRRRDDSRRGLQILFDDEQHKNDEEERIIDKLLIHYSKKPSSCEEVKTRRKSKTRHAHHMGSDAGEAPRKSSSERSDQMSETISRPARSISLPHEQTGKSEVTKVYARATSFQQDRSNPPRHVHPNLPDCDELAARFAAMKGRFEHT